MLVMKPAANFLRKFQLTCGTPEPPCRCTCEMVLACRYFEGFIQKADERSPPIVAGHAIVAAALTMFTVQSVKAQRKAPWPARTKARSRAGKPRKRAA